MNEEKIMTILRDMGITIQNKDCDEIILGDYINDSLDFVNFFIELEQVFDIEIPDSEYNKNLLSFNIKEIKNLILRCKGGEEDEIPEEK